MFNEQASVQNSQAEVVLDGDKTSCGIWV